MVDFELLVKSPVFFGLLVDRLKSIFEDVHYQVRKFDKNDLVVQAGTECSQIDNCLVGKCKRRNDRLHRENN